jgi:hypothetical protein
MSKLPVFKAEKTCEECFEVFIGAQYGEDVCRTCRSMLALEKIADAIQYWVDHQ